MELLSHPQLETALGACRDSLERAARGELPDSAAISRLFESVHAELALILREHAGMTEELLRVYEQLGIVFEITRKLPTVSTEQEVVQLFIDSLRVTYQGNSLWVVYVQADDTLLWEPGEHDPLDGTLDEIVWQSIRSGEVSVGTIDAADGEPQEVLSAPVFAGTECPCAIVLTHGVDARPFESSDMSLMEALAVYCGDLIRNHRLTIELRNLSMDLVRALVSAIDQKDEYTSGHSNRVGMYARMLGEELELDDEALQMVEWSAILHDVGKIGIRDDVLKKQGKLTAEEYRHIKEHPVRSYEVVKNIPQLRAALAGVRHHHEHYNGTGYPDGLAGEDIPLQARIVQVADVFDALTTSRSYRDAFDLETALGIMREEAGKVMDPKLVEAFEQRVRREQAAGRTHWLRDSPDDTGAPQVASVAAGP